MKKLKLNNKTVYILGFGSLAVIVMCFVVFSIFVNRFTADNNKVEPLVYTSTKDVETAVLWHSEKLFKSGDFDGISVIDKELLDYKQLDKYSNFTEVGTVYAYELLYRLKTDDERALIDNKIIGELVEPNSWLEQVAAHRCIVLFELDDVYYNVFSWDFPLTTNEYHWDSIYYGGSNSSNKDWLESNIIKAIFKNPKKIPNFEISPILSSESVLRKLLRDIVINAKTDFGIEFDKSRVYGFTYDYGIDAIYFRADLVNADDEYLVDNIGFSLFLNGGFSIGERELLPAIEELKAFPPALISDEDFILKNKNTFIKLGDRYENLITDEKITYTRSADEKRAYDTFGYENFTILSGIEMFSVTSETPALETHRGIRVGKSIQDVFEKYGTTDKTPPNSFWYHYNGKFLIFYVDENDKIIQIKIEHL